MIKITKKDFTKEQYTLKCFKKDRDNALAELSKLKNEMSIQHRLIKTIDAEIHALTEQTREDIDYISLDLILDKGDTLYLTDDQGFIYTCSIIMGFCGYQLIFLNSFQRCFEEAYGTTISELLKSIYNTYKITIVGYEKRVISND